MSAEQKRKIITNNVPRDLLSGYDIPNEIWKEHFEYLTTAEMNEAVDRFFKYRGEWYDVNEFTWHQDSPWDGIQWDTFFSATVIKYRDNFESVIVGRIYA
jgi:hypothetical protein